MIKNAGAALVGILIGFLLTFLALAGALAVVGALLPDAEPKQPEQQEQDNATE